MIRSDVAKEGLDDSFHNINTINVDAVANIERELDPYDVISMVFLLYDVPETALQRLIVYQRVSKDGDNNLNLLSEWAQHQHARAHSSWRYELLEALAICQLYGVIRKLGFKVNSVKKHYLPDNIHKSVYINLMKKALYKLCENITATNLETLQNTLKTYLIDTTENITCELVVLELMCKKFISVDNFHLVKEQKGSFKVEELVKILQKFPEHKKFASDLREIERRHNNEPDDNVSQPILSGNVITSMLANDTDDNIDKCYVNYFQEVFAGIEKLHLDETYVKNLKADTKIKVISNAYPIKNPKQVGVCYIINQEDFHPSKESIERNIISEPLDKRSGSHLDKTLLDQTMSGLNFEVISHSNVDHKKMMDLIKDIIKYRVQPTDSMFMLCILSHGVKGHVFAADSVKVNVEDIENLVDNALHERKLEIPKILILQACQVNGLDEAPNIQMAADGPSDFRLRKSDFLIYWATSSDQEAYRVVDKGSLLIQALCYYIKKYADHEGLCDICTRATDFVASVCTNIIKKQQQPIFKSTLRKKLFLKCPAS